MSYQNNNYGIKPAPRRWDKGYEFFKGDELNVKWVSEYARDFSDLLSDNDLSSTQLRSFYNEFLRIRDLTATPHEKVILIKLLEAKVTYRKNSGGKIPNEIIDFICCLVNQIGDSEVRFLRSCYMMEAIVGFFQDKHKKQRNNFQNDNKGKRS
jgi:CRISPR/Cas system CSM-associated protein Csm2 small subunit